MQKFFSLILTGFFALASGGVAQDRQQPAAQSPGFIVVMRVTGEAYVFKQGETVRFPLKSGSIVSQGQMIATAPKASVMLAFSNGTTVTIGENSLLSIDEFVQKPFSEIFKMAEAVKEPSRSETRMNLIRGDVITNVKKLNTKEGSKFEIKTPVGLAGIRGTTFQIEYTTETVPAMTANSARNAGRNASFGLVLLEGVVELDAGAHARPVAVSQGRQLRLDNLRLDAGGAPVALGNRDFATSAPSPAVLASLHQRVQAMLAEASRLTMSQSGAGENADDGATDADNSAAPSPAPQNPAPRLSPTDGVR